MPTRPRAKIGRHMIPGLAAAALFTVMATVFMRAQFPADFLDAVGFDGSVTASIGYALFDLTGAMAESPDVQGVIASDQFLAAFEIIDIVLVAALVGGVMLARRDEGGSLRTAIADGGRELLGRDGTDDEAGEGDTAERRAETTAESTAETATHGGDA